MTTVACVLRSGGDYGPEWVERLAAGVREHAPGVDFWCLSDLMVHAEGVECVPLARDWPGWWAKLGLFHPAMSIGERRYLFMDLDTLVLGDLADLLAYSGPFAILRDFYRPRNLQSAVMAWTPGPHTDALWERFNQNPAGHMRRFRSDQEFIQHALREDGFMPDILQDLYPRQFVSFKVHARQGPPDGARVLCFHGKPRPNDPAAGWAHVAWKRQTRAAA